MLQPYNSAPIQTRFANRVTQRDVCKFHNTAAGQSYLYPPHPNHLHPTAVDQRLKALH
jgi:hypothetical protein